MADRDERGRDQELDERVVNIDRVSNVVKGGRRFSFRALTVVGDRNGRVGVGVGKAREVPAAIRKGFDRARDNMVSVSLSEDRTLAHELTAEYGAARVFMKPASPGTGVIAGGGARAVLEAAGVKDVLSKSLGSDNIVNVVRATLKGLTEIMDIESRARARGKSVEDLLPPWKAAE